MESFHLANAKGMPIQIDICPDFLRVVKKGELEIARESFIGCRFYKKQESANPKLELIYSVESHKEKGQKEDAKERDFVSIMLFADDTKELETFQEKSMRWLHNLESGEFFPEINSLKYHRKIFIFIDKILNKHQQETSYSIFEKSRKFFKANMIYYDILNVEDPEEEIEDQLKDMQLMSWDSLMVIGRDSFIHYIVDYWYQHIEEL